MEKGENNRIWISRSILVINGEYTAAAAIQQSVQFVDIFEMWCTEDCIYLFYSQQLGAGLITLQVGLFTFFFFFFFPNFFFQMTWKRPHSVRFHHAWGGHSPWQTPQRCGFSHLEGVFELGGKKGKSASHVCSARPAAVFIMSLLEGTEMNDIGVFFSRELWHSPLKENNALFSSQSTQSEHWKKKKNLIAIHLNESTANQVINPNKDASVWHHYCKYAIALSCSDVSTPPILWHLDTFYGVFGREEEERGR